MRALARFIFSRQNLGAIIGVLTISILIAVFGGWLIVGGTHPLASVEQKLIAIVLVVLVWLAAETFMWWRRQRVDAGVLRQVLRSTADADRQMQVAEVAAMREAMRDTLTRLGRDKRRRILGLPWYLLIGPADGGKGELIEQSGLNMPFEEQLGRHAIATRQAALSWRWWFTDEALLIGGSDDLARESPPDSPVRAGWRNMLAFILHRRRRRPLDGVVVVIPATDLFTEAAPAAARAMSQRLREAMGYFAARLQVYVVINHCDALPGFSAFFARLDRDALALPFGVTLPAGAGQPGRAGALSAGEAHPIPAVLKARLDDLTAAIGRQLPSRAAIEPDPAMRARMALFPEQMAALSEAVTRFADILTETARDERAPMLRGVFMTSTVRSEAGPAGSPASGSLGGSALGAAEAARHSPAIVQADGWHHRFSRVVGLAAAPLRAGAPANAASRANPGQEATFVSGLFRRLIFPEAGLAGGSLRGASRLAILNGTGYAACVAALIATLGWCYAVFDRHAAALSTIRAGAATERAMLPETLTANGLTAVLPTLDEARTLSGVEPASDRDTWLLGIHPLGITAARKASLQNYDRALLTYLLPALMADLERQLRTATAGANRTQVRSLLTTYLMLGDPSHYQRDRIATWANGIAQADFALDPTRRTAARAHVTRLLDLLPAPVNLDQSLIGTARAQLRQLPDADEAYARLKTIALNTPAAQPLDVVNALGSAGAQLLMLRSQAGLPVVVPALYTRDGFYRIFLTEAPALARGVDANDWVLGGGAGAAGNAAAILQTITSYYTRDYVTQWQTIVGQIALRALPDLPSLAGGLQTMAGQDSPIIQFITLIKQQTDLEPPVAAATGLLAQATSAVAGAATAAGGSGAAAAAGSAAANLAQRAADLAVPAVIPTDPQNWPGNAIRTPFVPLQMLLDTKSGQAPVLRVQNTLATAYGTVSGVASAQAPDAAAQQIASQVLSGQGADPLVALRVQAATLPRPLDSIFRQLHANIWTTFMGLTMNRIETSWARDVAPVCEQSLARRYPFTPASDPGAARDVQLKDFSAFFGPNGVMDKFIAGNLALFTTTGADGKLSLTSQNGLSLGLSRDALAQINRARAIRDLFFGSDGSLLVRFWITPTYLDPRVMSATIQSDQTRFVYRHEAPRPIAFTWPPTGDGGASFSLTTTNGDVQQTQIDGTWAIFQLLQSASNGSPTPSARLPISFNLNGFIASYGLRAESVNNPFVDRSFMDFRCVARL